MTVKLFFNAICKFILGVVLVGVLIFLPAGTFYFFNGWLLMAVLFIPMFIAGVIMMFKNPELLRKRLVNELSPHFEIEELHYGTYAKNSWSYIIFLHVGHDIFVPMLNEKID